MKQTTTIAIVVLVFAVIGVVVYMFAKSNSDNVVIEKTTTSTGLGNVLSTPGGQQLFSKLFNLG